MSAKKSAMDLTWIHTSSPSHWSAGNMEAIEVTLTRKQGDDIAKCLGFFSEHMEQNPEQHEDPEIWGPYCEALSKALFNTPVTRSTTQ